MTVRIIAKLDVKPPYVVKPVHFEGLRKMGSPAELAKKYYDQGADELFY
jgi:cyclase